MFHLDILELSERREGGKAATGRLKEWAESVHVAGLPKKNMASEIWRNMYILKETEQKMQIGKQ